jgi:hypothetical protein
MNRRLVGIAVLGMLAATQTFAVDSINQSPTNQRLQSNMNQRQLRGCMLKRMVADKALAYNEAKRACTDQLRARNDSSARPLAAATTQTGS